MVKKTTLHEFVSKNGYELIQKLGKSETSRLLNMDRKTIYTLLKEFPTAPLRTLPKYVFQWEETEGNKMFIEKYRGRARDLKMYVAQGLRAWLKLDKKDPIAWDTEDFNKIWNDEGFRDPNTGKMRFEYAVIFRKWMRVLGRGEFCNMQEFTTKGLKRPKGGKKQWFLEDDEITRLIEAIDREDLLVAFVLSLLSGGRASSVMESRVSKGIRPMDIDERNYGILMFEPKRQEYVLRLFHAKLISLVKKYISDCAVKPNESLFPSYDVMRKLLKSAGLKGNVSKIADMMGSWHITKHTFVSQGAYHGLSIEVISEQTGTDAKTLMDYYAGMKEKKMRAELLGEKLDIEPFHAWALRVIIEPAIRRYEELQVTISVTGDK
jgi:integrase